MAKNENGEGSIYFEKARNKYCAAIINPDGKRLRKRFAERDEAKQWLIDMKAQFLRNEYVAPNSITLGEWIIEWMTTFKQDLRDKSKLQYMQTSKKLQPIANIPLQDITPVMVQKFLNKLPTTMASSSKKKVYQLLFTVTKKAFNLGMINKNFMGPVEPPTVKTHDIEIFTQNNIHDILDYLKSDGISPNLAKLYPFVLLAITTGARLGELLALKWENVDLNEHKIHIVSNLQYIPHKGIIENPPKTAAGVRYITLPLTMVNILKELKRGSGNVLRMVKPSDYVFHTKTGTPYQPGNITHYWRSIVTGAGVPYKNFHVLRHTHATQLLAANIPILEVAKRLGHSKASHTLNLYGHAIPNKDKDVAEKVAQIYAI